MGISPGAAKVVIANLHLGIGFGSMRVYDERRIKLALRIFSVNDIQLQKLF